ncbi:DUF2004 domain-containing protein [Agromyces aureus]|uniref:DUF2004 domain-containing protein n=1 Tax=Agromyces aureus TaxID=453304 RepID=A0A191WEM4_9MICO|nr:DUF2004 domain-containing protein [Agromyces aureus]ANJ26725.1 hypothetical protein ATC03_08370 [Agromyces aureus]
MATEHDYFGVVGDYWSEMIEYADQRVEVVLETEDDDVPIPALDAAAALVSELEFADDEVRNAFVGQLDSGSSPAVKFLTVLLDPESEVAEEVEEAIGRDSGDRQIDALRSMTLVRVDLRPELFGDGEAFAEFEYALAPDETDERLIATIDVGRDVVDARFEG